MAEFLVDVMCGSLATHLRMCGHDTAYALDRGVEADDALRELALEEERTLVTRDGALARRAEDAVLLESTSLIEQLRTLRDEGYDLSLDEPTRCSACNGRLREVPSDGEAPAHAPGPEEERVWRCRDCGKHFWKGSHWDAVRDRLSGL